MIECVVLVGTSSFHSRGRTGRRVLASSYDLLYCCLLASLLIFASTTGADENPQESTLETAESSDNSDGESEAIEDLGDDWESNSDEENSGELSLTTLEAILAYEANDFDYKTTRRCLESRRVRDYDVLSDRFILVQMRDLDTKYLIQFNRKCVGMTKGATLRFDSRRSSSTRVCTNDSVRANMATGWGPSCRLPGFEPVNEVQLEQLKRGLVSDRVE